MPRPALNEPGGLLGGLLSARMSRPRIWSFRLLVFQTFRTNLLQEQFRDSLPDWSLARFEVRHATCLCRMATGTGLVLEAPPKSDNDTMPVEQMPVIIFL